MKFTCERCGKKYATAEDPAPGRVYKLKCKACGHLIVVKPSVAAPEGHPASSSRTPADPPSISLEIAAPEPAIGSGPLPRAFDATTEVSTAAMRNQHSLEMTPPPGDAGYVDLFSDVVSGATELPQKPHEDPFLAAARASLPETYGSGSSNAPDPFAGLREDISAVSAPSEPPPRPAPSVPKVPVIPKPKQEKSAMPIVLIGAGVAVMVGILAFVMLSSGGSSKPPAAPAVAVARPPPAPSAPVAAPPVEPEPAPVVPAPPAQIAPPPQTAQTAPAKAKPAPDRSDEADRRARAEQKRKERDEAKSRADQARAEREARDREAKAQSRADREAKDRDKAEREARVRADREAKAERDRRAREERDQAAADARERERAARQASAAEQASAEPEGGLTQGQIEGVLRSTKGAFDGCIQAARGSDVKLDGRRVMMRLNIQTSGAVTYPTLDDVTLNGTELGSCLKSAARLMVFPKFKGDTMHVEVPLVMR